MILKTLQKYRARIMDATSSIPHFDKILHVIVGAIIATLVFLGALYWMNMSVFSSLLIGFFTGTLAGAVKEFIDYFMGGYVEWNDFWATVVGAGLVAIPFLILK